MILKAYYPKKVAFLKNQRTFGSKIYKNSQLRPGLEFKNRA